jgi:hypothetical protein
MKYKCLARHGLADFLHGMQAINGLGCQECRNLHRHCPGPVEVKEPTNPVEQLCLEEKQ